MSSRTRIAIYIVLLVVFIIGIFTLLTGECHAWTDHEFQARLSGEDDWHIQSLPESIARSEDYDMAGKMGYLSYVYVVREDIKWDTDLMYIGPIAMDEEIQNFAKLHIVPMIKAIDKLLPNEKMVVIMFLADYTEMSVWFEPDRWKNREFHDKIAKKLNIERQKWKKSAITDQFYSGSNGALGTHGV
jgi:hypothetical protein